MRVRGMRSTSRPRASKEKAISRPDAVSFVLRPAASYDHSLTAPLGVVLPARRPSASYA
jgi:hypothetical protein